MYYVYPGGAKWLPLTTVQTDSRGYYQATVTVPAAVSFSSLFVGSRHYRATWGPTRWISIAQTLPPDGTMYWDPANSCHYHVANRTWYGDYCVAYQTDSSGNAIKTVYNIYAFDSATSSAGAILYQLNTADPEWLEWRVPSDPEFQTVRWAAVPRNNLSAEPKLEIDFQGQWQWTTRAELQQLVATLEAVLAAEQTNGQTATTTNIVTVGGASESSQALTDLVNGVDRLGGNVQMGQALSNVYSIGISEPFTPGVCGEYGSECSPTD